MAEHSFPHEDYPVEATPSVTESEYARSIGWASTSGIFGHPTDPAPLFLSGGALYLRVGTAGRILGVAYENRDTDQEVTIAANAAGSVRLDHVVLRLDWSTMLVRHAVLQGTAGGPLPGLTQVRAADEFEISLGQVSIPAGGTVADATLTSLAWYLGQDGQIWCTSTTRPPHQAGRRIWETDTGRQMVSDGTTWLRVTEDAGPTTISLATGITAPQNLLRRRNGIVVAHLSVRRSTPISGGTTVSIGTVPAGYRPLEAVAAAGMLPGSGQVVAFDITAAGAVSVSTDSSTSISANRSIVANLAWPVA
jgi:hypothetical protein